MGRQLENQIEILYMHMDMVYNLRNIASSACQFCIINGFIVCVIRQSQSSFSGEM